MRGWGWIFCVALVAQGFHAPPKAGWTSTTRVGMAKKGKLRELRSGSAPKKKRPDLVPVPGITPPARGKLKGWEIGRERPVRLVAARIGDQLYALESTCSRCAWELEKGDIVDGPAVSCALCGQTYSLSSGMPGAVVERSGLNQWLGSLARNAPTTNVAKSARTVRCALDGDVVLLDVAGSFLAEELKSS